MNDLELLQSYIADNLYAIQNGTRENAVAILKTFCDENNVASYEEAHELHYYMKKDTDPSDWLAQAKCTATGEGHAFSEVYVAPTISEDGIKILVCGWGGDAMYFRNLPAYGEGYSGKIDTGFFCSDLIMNEDEDFSCFLPEGEEKELVTDEAIESNVEQVSETTLPDPVVRESKNIAPGIAVGVLAAILIGLVVYFLKSRK